VDEYGYGFRSPALLVSPYAKRGHIDGTQLDFTSPLKFIENNWGIPPLAERDRAANDITSAFDFSASPRDAALLGSTRAPTGLPVTRTSVVYLAYGSAVVLLALFITIAARRGRRLPREVVT
jgi:phospholipase C